MSEPVRLAEAIPDAWFEVLEAAWERDGLRWSGPSLREPSGALSFEREAE